MGLFGIIWELALQPVVVWVSRKWVRFVLRKRTWWSPGVPFPRYFGQIGKAILHTPASPRRVLGALSPVPSPRESRKSVVPGSWG